MLGHLDDVTLRLLHGVTAADVGFPGKAEAIYRARAVGSLLGEADVSWGAGASLGLADVCVNDAADVSGTRAIAHGRGMMRVLRRA